MKKSDRLKINYHASRTVNSICVPLAWQANGVARDGGEEKSWLLYFPEYGRSRISEDARLNIWVYLKCLRK